MDGPMKRTRFLIDTNFQLKTTFRILGVIIIAFILIIAVTGLISMDNNGAISSSIKDLEGLMAKDRDMIERLIAAAGQRGALDPGHDGLIADHLETMALMQKNAERLKEILGLNRLLVTVTILAGVVMALVLFAYLIVITHRISGPLYVLSRHMRDIMEGREPDLRDLRKNDEFKDFYRQFIDFLDGKDVRR